MRFTECKSIATEMIAIELIFKLCSAAPVATENAPCPPRTRGGVPMHRPHATLLGIYNNKRIGTEGNIADGHCDIAQAWY